MNRSTLIAAAAAALAAAAVAAVPGSAQTGPSRLHLVSTPLKGGFFPKHVRPGATFGFVYKVSGDDTGTGRSVCTAVGGKGLCTLQIQLAKGTLSAQGMIPEHARNVPTAITGGTGAYDGARGTAFATDLSANRTTVDVELLP